MKSRQVNFYVDLVELPQVITTIEKRVIPRFESLPHFLGLTAIKADVGERANVIVTSFWDDGLEGSEREAVRFIAEIQQVTGLNPARMAFDTIYAQVRDAGGTFCRREAESAETD